MISGALRKKDGTSFMPWTGINREPDFQRFVTVYHTISDIPWNEDDSKAFVGDADVMRRVVETLLQQRGENPQIIPFMADKWILHGVTIKFDGLPQELFNKIRKFVLFETIRTRWSAYTTISAHVDMIRRFVKLYGKTHPDFYFTYVHIEDIESFINDVDIATSSKKSMISSLILFTKFVEINYKEKQFGITSEELEKLSATLSKRGAKAVSSGYNSVPDIVFNQMHRTMMKLIRNPKTPFDETVAAALLILAMWTGLRPKELRILRRGHLVSEVRNGKTLWFYRYVSPKNKGRVQKVYLFAPALEAVKALEQLQTRREVVHITQYLVSFWDNISGESETDYSIYKMIDGLLAKHMSIELSKPHSWLTEVTVKNVTIHRPSLYQFRVHLCTYLIDHGLDDRWVEGHLGHLASMMRGKYYRMKNWRREELRQKVLSVVPDAAEQAQEIIKMLESQKTPVPKLIAELKEMLNKSNNDYGRKA